MDIDLILNRYVNDTIFSDQTGYPKRIVSNDVQDLVETIVRLRTENGRLREQLRKAHITTVARLYNDEPLDCEGDGSGPDCETDVTWEIQAMDASGSHYSYVCSEHLDSYQKWAEEDGRQPLVFEVDE